MRQRTNRASRPAPLPATSSPRSDYASTDRKSAPPFTSNFPSDVQNYPAEESVDPEATPKKGSPQQTILYEMNALRKRGEPVPKLFASLPSSLMRGPIWHVSIFIRYSKANVDVDDSAINREPGMLQHLSPAGHGEGGEEYKSRRYADRYRRLRLLWEEIDKPKRCTRKENISSWTWMLLSVEICRGSTRPLVDGNLLHYRRHVPQSGIP